MDWKIPSIGIHHGVSPEEYHSWQALSHSWMNRLRISPAHLLDLIENGHDQRDASLDMTFGSAVHCYVLEPDQYLFRYAVRPEGMNGVTKEGKAFKAEAVASGREVLDFKMARWVEAVARRAENNARVAEWMHRQHTVETSLVWERDGYLCKARADLMVPGLNILADLKTTVTASEKGFAAQVAKYFYHGQAAWYIDGAQRLTNEAWDFWFIACEKRRPFLVTAHQLVRDGEAHIAAVRENDRLFALYANCMSTGQWPGYGDTFEITLPVWATEESVEPEEPFE